MSRKKKGDVAQRRYVSSGPQSKRQKKREELEKKNTNTHTHTHTCWEIVFRVCGAVVAPEGIGPQERRRKEKGVRRREQESDISRVGALGRNTL